MLDIWLPFEISPKEDRLRSSGRRLLRCVWMLFPWWWFGMAVAFGLELGYLPFCLLTLSMVLNALFALMEFTLWLVAA